MDDIESWREILKESLQVATQGSQKPVPGARLRKTVAEVAEGRGLSYPPRGLTTGKFLEFVEAFPTEAIFVRRESGDVWIAPAAHPELLTKSEADGAQRQVGIRQDLFAAFTRFDELQSAWYDPLHDVVLWEEKSSNLPDPWKRIPAADIPRALEDRKAFVETIAEPASKARLTEALRSERSLTAFAAAVRELGLQPIWHRFWISLLTDRIKHWADSWNLVWNSAWITASPRGADPAEARTAPGSDVNREWRNNLAMFFQSLTESDLQRISIPLDIVVKSIKRL